MTWKTHAVVGANSVWLAALLTPVDEWGLVLIAAGAFVGILPDIDTGGSGAKIHYVGRGVFGMFVGVFTHRGFFHSLFAGAIVACVSYVLLTPYHLALPLVVTAAYMSHPIIDGLNYPGVMYLYPLKKKIRLVPKSWATPVKGGADSILFFAGIIGLILYILQFLPYLVGNVETIVGV